MATLVVNLHDPAAQPLIIAARAAGRLVAVHRPTKWGNPFSHQRQTLARFRVDSRLEAVRRHALWIVEQPELMGALDELRGKVLACFCVPKPCHACTLARLVDGV